MIITLTLNPAVDQTLLVPEVRLGETNRVRATDIDPGGKGLNVARMLKRLGRPAVTIALVGGPTGHYIRHRLEHEGVETDLVEIRGTTRINISILDESSGIQTNFNQEGAEIDPTDLLAVEAKIAGWLQEMDVMAMGGSLPPGAPSDTYARLIRWINESGIRTALDSSGEALREGIKAQPYLIKPNIREAQDLLGRTLTTDEDVIAAAEELRSRGISVVVISMGKRGAIAVDEKGVWKAISPNVKVGSTIGAGDSMMAGLVIGIAEHMSLPDSLALGTAAATATVMNERTELGTPDQVQELLPLIRVEKIK
ncbi:MAG: 1-phosphofructokinase [Armatimonadota bacterium]|nr:1-phosphofructokinase [Armatimonadota bacterium]